MISLVEAKSHLAISQSDLGDDLLIQGMIDAAIDHLASIDVPVNGAPLPPAIRQAVLLLVAHFYANREAATDAQVHVLPLGVSRLIAPYRSVSL